MRFISIAVAVSVLGCSSGEEAKTAEADVCGDSARAASARVLTVASANATCEVDADCSVVPVGASCFDACTRSVNATGKTAVDRAETLVEAAECKQFRAAGCKVVPPPCAPPRPATCRNGRCE